VKRVAYQQLIDWKNKESKKPLIVQGARQVGKTWLINQFGRNEYQHYFRFNFEEDIQLHSIFETTLDPKILIEKLSLYLNRKIEEKNCLIFFDEIQACPKAITSLKYFYEKLSNIHIIAAGSLLGVRVNKPSSFPVGKVNFLDLYPLNFYEFLMAFGQDLLASHLENSSLATLDLYIHERLTEFYKLHLYLGGMPEVVQDYIVNKNPISARKIQLDILESYQNDFSKYNTPLQSIKILEVWGAISYQLAKENKKFKYSDVKDKARASSYESAIYWLKQAGLVYIVNQIRDVKLPLAGYKDEDKFKLYMLDTGILGAMLQISSNLVIEPIALFKEYNGAFVENYVCCELVKLGFKDIYYWKYERGSAEVDFIIQNDHMIIPIEVKSGSNKNTTGLRNFEAKYKPKRIFRTSPKNVHLSDSFINLPLYLLFSLPKILKEVDDL
jgi:uncharacterized protein